MDEVGYFVYSRIDMMNSESVLKSLVNNEMY